ncbi:MAG TPA: FG-GAP-like repeat-containing protein, partial [Telluria sp.]|nr:FG-GAP-like repeat-containing protein [Telluria sp.]
MRHNGEQVKIQFSGRSVTSDIAIKVAQPSNYTGGPFWEPFSLGVRSVQTADMNGDGFLDIFMSPSYTTYAAPGLHPVVLLNDGKGHFRDGTASVFAAGTPQIGAPNNVFINHFTSDGHLGMFIVDQGLELRKADGSPDWDNGWKAKLQFWLQDEAGVFRDMSANIDINPLSFNHLSSIADVNSDGNLDVVVTRLGGPTVEGWGTGFYLGDGRGNFHFSTAGIPAEIRYVPNEQRKWDATLDYQFSGTNTVADLNGDGRADLVTASYTGGDQVSGNKTIRVFHQDASGQFVAAFSTPQPAAVRALGDMGAAAIVAGDLNGDGRPDLVVAWEGAAGEMVEVLKNTGNGTFEDVTADWLGSYLPRSPNGRDATGEWMHAPAALRLEDVNHDGRLDLVMREHGMAGVQFATGSAGAAFVYLNDGTGHLSAALPVTAASALTAAQIGAMSGIPDYQLGIPLQFDTTNSGHNDFVFIATDVGLNTSVSPANVTSLHVTTIFNDDGGTIYRAPDSGAVMYGANVPGTFYGGIGADELHGGAVNDTFHGLAGRDRIDGGAGIDVLVLDGAKAGYAVTARMNGSAEVVQSAHAWNHADLTGVERLRFADAAVALDIAGNAGKAYRIYQAAFDRQPDPEGLGFWINAMDHGMSLADIAAGFIGSNEFIQRYGDKPAAADLVGRLYQNILHRAP